ncbi:hypothetical protein EJB05_50852, partial [Eragrostis curvula]
MLRPRSPTCLTLPFRAVSVSRRESVHHQRRAGAVRVDVQHGQVGRHEDEGHSAADVGNHDDMAVAPDAACEGGEEVERGLERALEDGEGVVEWVGRQEEAERAEGDVKHIAILVGIEADGYW